MHLGGNQLTSLPAEVRQLAGLTELDLIINQLTSLPAEVRQLAGLTELDLHGNQLTSLPAEGSSPASRFYGSRSTGQHGGDFFPNEDIFSITQYDGLVRRMPHPSMVKNRNLGREANFNWARGKKPVYGTVYGASAGRGADLRFAETNPRQRGKINF